jgi:Zinc carboxypeptidase
MSNFSQTAKDFADIWDNHHVTKIFPSDVRHKDLQKYLEELKKIGIKVEEAGRSNANREIYQIEWGKGPLRIFMWSQMHGDEPTATSALIDMFAYFQKHRSLTWVKNIEENLTIRAVPMLNPDGAELYQRRNLQGIDINRDAINLATPEARLLKKLRDDWSPNIGFNLHNQNELTTAGPTSKQAAISLLVVYGDAAKTPSEGHERNKRVASAVVQALNNFIPGHIARYDDEYTSTAFGDNFSAWGTPVLLIETGALNGKDEMFLVKMNFVAFLTALTSIASGREKAVDAAAYTALPENSSGKVENIVFQNALLADPNDPSKLVVSNIAVHTERSRASYIQRNIVRSIGNLNGLAGLVEYDADGFVVVQKFGKIKVGDAAELFFYKKDRQVNWDSKELEKEFSPDAVFSLGKWIKGEGLIRKKL